jgi:hypothetical protein
MMFHATFTNISVISRQSVLLVEETGGPVENHRLNKTITSSSFNYCHNKTEILLKVVLNTIITHSS